MNRVVACVAGASFAGVALALACGGGADGERRCEGESCEAGSDASISADATDTSDAADASTPLPPCDGPPGTLDTTFGDGGVVVVPMTARASSVVVMPDGSVVVAVFASVADTPGMPSKQIGLVRLRSNGARDFSFGQGGIARMPLYYWNALPVVAAQQDGNIVIASSVHDGERGDAWMVLRRLTDGGPDPSFGADGSVVAEVADITGAFGYSTPAGIAVQADGRIVVSGSSQAQTMRGTYAVARLLVGGGLDPSFGVRGKRVLAVRGTPDAPGALALAANGAIVVAGGSPPPDAESPRSYDVSAVRVTPDGSVDTSFADAGRLLVERDASSQAFAAASDANGRILLAGYLGDDIAVFGVTPNGDVDPTFGDAGVATLDVDGGVDVAKAVFAQADGSVLVAGSTRAGTTYQAALARYLPSGAMDPSFGTGGVAVAPLVDASASSVVENAAVDRCHVVTVGSQAADAGTLQAIVVARWRR